MFKIIVLVSGSGTNMLQLIKNDIKIDCIIADRECKAKNIADEYKIDFILLNRNKEISKNLLKIFEERKPDIIVLAGFLSILDGEILEKFNVNGMAHITGGGLYENLPRCMGKDLSPVVFREKERVPEIFKLIAERSKIKEEELFGTFNMGVGFTLVVEEKDVEPIIELLTSLGETAYEIGHIEKGDHSLCLK